MIEKRMNKNELIELLNTLKIDKNEFALLSTSALVLRGIYPDAGDIDMNVTEKGLQELNKNYNITIRENGWYKVTDKVDCVCKSFKDFTTLPTDNIQGYYLQNINEYYNYLIKSTKEKDILRIPIVEKYISKGGYHG